MKFKTVAVAVATAVLSFGAVGPAAAHSLGQMNEHAYASPPQINGSRLQAGLLPESAFGDAFTFEQSLNSGSKLQTTHASRHVPTMSCEAFEDNEYVSFLGETAGATEEYVNTDWRATWPFAIYLADQDVVQFATDQAATTYFGQAYAKYVACRSFSVPNPGDTAPGGGSYVVGSTSTSTTTVGGHHAFLATELWSPSEASGRFLHIDVLFVVSGTNVYNLWEVAGTNDEPSPTLMSDLIHRVQSLYR